MLGKGVVVAAMLTGGIFERTVVLTVPNVSCMP